MCIRLEKKLHPESEIYMDGDLYAWVSKPRA